MLELMHTCFIHGLRNKTYSIILVLEVCCLQKVGLYDISRTIVTFECTPSVTRAEICW